jgi:hypothetical protein
MGGGSNKLLRSRRLLQQEKLTLKSVCLGDKLGPFPAAAAAALSDSVGSLLKLVTVDGELLTNPPPPPIFDEFDNDSACIFLFASPGR